MTNRLQAAWVAVFLSLLWCVESPAQPSGARPDDTLAQLAIPAPDLSAAQSVIVLSVADGDTLNVLVGESIEKVRLVGVDAPESKDPREDVGFYGAEASAFLENLLKGERVYLLPEPGSDRDKYGRRLAHVYRAPDGLWVNLELVRQGYAQVYSQPAFESLDLFLAYQRAARKAEKGLWNTEARDQWESLRKTLPERTPPSRPLVIAPPPAPTQQPPAPSVQAPSETPQPESNQVTVYVTRTGAKYHRAGCSYLSKSSIPIALKEAKVRYGPCSRCRPPG